MKLVIINLTNTKLRPFEAAQGLINYPINEEHGVP